MDGLQYQNISICSSGTLGVRQMLVASVDGQSAWLTRDKCQDLNPPQSIDTNQIIYLTADKSSLEWKDQVFDEVTGSNCSHGVALFGYTGSDQTFTPPAGCKLLTFRVWGAGGGGGSFGNFIPHPQGGVGGGGGFASGQFTATAGQLFTVKVGGGGGTSTTTGTGAGGISDQQSNGSPASSTTFTGGNGGWNYNPPSSTGGGGAGGMYGGGSGGQTSSNYEGAGGGGGGGSFGGGGGAGGAAWSGGAGGGGGNSYVLPLTNGIAVSASESLPGGVTDSSYPGNGVAVGGPPSAKGGDGFVVISY